MVHLEDFRLLASFEPNPTDQEFDEEYAVELPPMLAAIRRFKHEYFYSIVAVKAGDQEDELELAFDITYVLPQIPSWLEQLATQNGRATLGFGAQGSERDLIAERQGDIIIYWFRPFFSDPEMGTRTRVSARMFLNEWIDLIAKVLDTLVNLQPNLVSDSEFQELKTFLEEMRTAIQ